MFIYYKRLLRKVKKLSKSRVGSKEGDWRSNCREGRGNRNEGGGSYRRVLWNNDF